MLGVDLIVKGEGWVDKAALLRLMRHVVRTYASRPTQHNALTVATWLQRHAEQAHAAGGGSGDVPGGMQSSRDKAGSSRRSSSSHGGRGRRGQSFSDSLGAPGLSPPVPVLELQGLAGALMHGCADALQSGAMEASLVPSFMRCMALSQVPLEQAWVDVAYSVRDAAVLQCLVAAVMAVYSW